MIVRLLIAQQVPLQLDADVFRPEDPDETIDEAAHAVARSVDDGAASQRDEAANGAIELVEIERALAFWRRQLHARHEAAEILVALTR